MTKKDKDKKAKEGAPIKLASSPCSIADVNPDYMGLSGLDKKQSKGPKKKDEK